MNSILLELTEGVETTDQTARASHLRPEYKWELPLEDRRARHILNILKIEAGREFHMGLIDHSIGRGKWTTSQGGYLQGTYSPSRDKTSSAATETRRSLILGLPRPKSLRRVLRMIGNLGLNEVHLIHTARVEKSYWGSPWLEPHAERSALLEGLEIACRGGQTLPCLPRINQHRLFRPFAEDQLPKLLSGSLGLVLHPGASDQRHDPGERRAQSLMFAIGPEGGFVDFEIDLFQRAGFRTWSFGERCWSVEVAVPYTIAYFSPR